MLFGDLAVTPNEPRRSPQSRSAQTKGAGLRERKWVSSCAWTLGASLLAVRFRPMVEKGGHHQLTRGTSAEGCSRRTGRWGTMMMETASAFPLRPPPRGLLPFRGGVRSQPFDIVT